METRPDERRDGGLHQREPSFAGVMIYRMVEPVGPDMDRSIVGTSPFAASGVPVPPLSRGRRSILLLGPLVQAATDHDIWHIHCHSIFETVSAITGRFFLAFSTASGS